MPISKRLVITLALALAGMLFVGGFGVWELSKSQARLHYISRNILPRLKSMNDARHAVSNMRANIWRFMYLPSTLQRQNALVQIADAELLFDQSMADYRRHDDLSIEDRRLLVQDIQALEVYRASLHRIMTLEMAGKRALANEALLNDAPHASDNVTAALSRHYVFNVAQADDLDRQNNARYHIVFVLSVAVIFATVLSFGLLFFFLYRYITGSQAALQEAAQSDPLTGCLNRRYLIAAGEKLMLLQHRTQAPTSVLFIDLDHFKSVNDRFGHLAGDAVIRATVQCVARRLRKSDALGRYGGEEFVVILPNCTKGDAMALAEDLRKEVAQISVHYQEGVIHITVSIGVAECYLGESSVMAAIDRSDKAMYLAKSSGRNCVVSG